ncbi:hypothetical protein BC830DRAFT_1064942 [Chytriomyces sp. MP71]|nr:hypothetical protein BC830DRAFT_1064942 [Chytriomyces sp. MP71]
MPNQSSVLSYRQPPPLLQLSAPSQSMISLPFTGNTASFPPSEATHAMIQSTWSLFAAMGDAQRNQMLKGLLGKCSSKQVDLICTCLNLKISQASSPTKTAEEAELEYIFNELHASSKPTSNRPIQGVIQPHNAANPQFVTANIYIKLLNTDYNPQTLLKQVRATSNIELTRNLFEFVLARTGKQQSLLALVQELSSGTELDSGNGGGMAVAGKLLKCALDVCGAGFGTLYRVDEATGDISVVASTWAKEGVIEASNGPPADRILGSLFLFKGEVVNMFNVKESELYTDDVHEFYGISGKCEVECVLSVPVKTGLGKVVGLIEMMNKAEIGMSPYFNAEDEHMMKCLGNIWTMLLSTSNSSGAARGSGGGAGLGTHKKDDLKMLMNTASFMSTDIDLNGLVRVVMQTAQELLNAERCACFLVDHKKKELWSSVAEGAGEIRIPMTKGIAGYVAMSGEILNIPNAYKDPRFNRSIDIKTGFRTRNILCIPMKNSKGAVIGVAQIINKLPDPSVFTVEDENLLTAFSALAATTIEKNMVFQDMQGVLDSATKEKLHLSKIVYSLHSVVITLEGTGKLTSINHPEALHLSPENLELMKYNAFDVWLGVHDNAQLIADIRSVFKGESAISMRNVELTLNGLTFSRRLRHDSYSSNGLLEEDEDEYESDEGSDEGGSRLSSDASDYQRNGKRLQKKERRRVEGIIVVIELIGEKERLDDTLAKYMTSDLIRKMNMEAVNSVEGKCEKTTCVSVNLRDYYNLTSKLDPSDALYLLNLHNNAIENVVTDYHGIVDKCSNERALCAFGLPFKSENDAFNAVQAAMNLLKTRDETNERMMACSLPATQISIGIGTGDTISGVIGSPRKLDYIITGNAVTLSSQILNATQLYETDLLICEKTQREIRDKFHLREIDHVIFKGTSLPVTLFEVLGEVQFELPRETITSTICFELGLSEYRNQNWSVAQLHFKKAVQTSDDGPSRMFVKRCQDLMESIIRMPVDWDGCWRMMD